MKYLFFAFFLCNGMFTYAQYGGKVQLRITFEDRPLVGYTITGSINGIDIGGKGVTDRHGEVTLNTDKLPTPQIDLKGTRSCGSNGNASFEVSGIVYISSGNYHLELDKVVCMMQKEFGVETVTLLAAYGITSCSDVLGKMEDNLASSNPYQTSGYRSTCESFLSSTSVVSNEPVVVETPPSLNNNTKSTEEENKSKIKVEQRKQEQEQRMEDFQSGKSAAENYENMRAMHENKVNRLTNEISAEKELLSREKEGTSKSNKLKYDIKELEIDRSIQLLKLEKVNKEISIGNKPLTKAERKLYKIKEEDLKTEKKDLKERRKAKEPFDDVTPKLENTRSTSEKTDNSQTVEGTNTQKYSGDELANMSLFDLKKLKLKTSTTIKKRKATLKVKGSLLNTDKKTAMEQEIESLTNLFSLIEQELVKRKEEE